MQRIITYHLNLLIITNVQCSKSLKFDYFLGLEISFPGCLRMLKFLVQLPLMVPWIYIFSLF